MNVGSLVMYSFGFINFSRAQAAEVKITGILYLD
jgi:hypothetical protein